MAGGIGPRERERLALLETMVQRVQQLHGLVERLAAERVDPDAIALNVKRTLTRMKRDFAGAGLDEMAQLSGSLELAAGRGGSKSFKVRILREGVGSLRAHLDGEQRATRAAALRQKEAEDPGGAGSPT